MMDQITQLEPVYQIAPNPHDKPVVLAAEWGEAQCRDFLSCLLRNTEALVGVITVHEVNSALRYMAEKGSPAFAVEVRHGDTEAAREGRIQDSREAADLQNWLVGHARSARSMGNAGLFAWAKAALQAQAAKIDGLSKRGMQA